MIDLFSLLWNFVVPFLIVLTVLVFVHELGHYLAARLCNVRVEVFSVGFGKEIFGFTAANGTRWKLGMIPVGGYVKMFGEMRPVRKPETEGSDVSSGDDDISFNTKSLAERSFIVSAGPLANFVFAILILTITFMSIGQPVTPADVGEVTPNSSAARAGFASGDLITKINGTRIVRFEEVVRIVRLSPGKSLNISVIRDGREIALTAIPDVINEQGRRGVQRYGRLGIKRSLTDRKFVTHGPFLAAWKASEEAYSLTSSIFLAIGQIISGKREAKELGGPLRIAQMSGDVWQAGLVSFLMFATVLSINLGIINLFPVPMLDGGHLMFYAIEALLGKPLGERAQEYAMRMGVAMVLALMLFATWNDLVQLQVVDFFIELVT